MVLEKEGAVDILEAGRCVEEAGGLGRVGPGGRGSEKELRVDTGSGGGGPAEAETHGWGTGRFDTGLGM